MRDRQPEKGRGLEIVLFGGLILYVGVLAAMALESAYYRFASPPEQLHFVGSATCGECHRETHGHWFDSAHRKMMRPVHELGDEFVNFHSDDRPGGLFQEDVEWVIGSKWEHQFMGHDGSGETLLPGAWQVQTASWKKTSWDGWSEPNPLYRCHGCHTVGLNVETGEFVEPGIGCESCHGAGDWHSDSDGKAGIYTRLDAEQCGQCHVRGRGVDGATFFPVSYEPGEPLEQHFTAWEADYIQNSSAWWGNGRERKRHQQYSAWNQGGHVNALKSLLEDYDGEFGEVTEDCMGCHSAEHAVYGTEDLSLDDAEHGVTCSVCHQVHGELAEPRMTCNQCHDKGAFHHKTETLANHVPCPPTAEVTCANCHMPKTVKIGGEYQLHSHHPGIVPPSDTAEFGVPNSCANGGCHSGDSNESMQIKFNTFYKKTLLAGAEPAPEPAP